VADRPDGPITPFQPAAAAAACPGTAPHATLVNVPALDVLLVEDSIEYAAVVTAVLRRSGHRIRVANTMVDALSQFAASPPDLVILDLTLPDGDGLDFCAQMREQSNAYILILTGRDDEVDKLVGFRLGADDYVTKPFSPRELSARIEALGRRPRTATADTDTRTVGKVMIASNSRIARIGRETLELTRIEFDLLDAFASDPMQVFTRAQLLKKVWGDHWFGDDHVVDVHVANLRKKLTRAGAANIIRTVRGIGYGLGV
jgi:DNA-binding response OmpR family regulator